MTGFSGAVSELSAHLTAGSSQPMLEVGAAGDGDNRDHSFSAFRAARYPIHTIPPDFSAVTQNWSFCSIRRPKQAETGGFSAHTANWFDPSGTLLGASPSGAGAVGGPDRAFPLAEPELLHGARSTPAIFPNSGMLTWRPGSIGNA
jgi:hypothetical protein